MMNGQVVDSVCDRLAEVILSDASRAERDRLQTACRLIFGRPAASEECAEWTAFLDLYQSASSSAGEGRERRRHLAWKGLCRALLSSNEFIYVN
jgi:hypothetical protein